MKTYGQCERNSVGQRPLRGRRMYLFYWQIFSRVRGQLDRPRHLGTICQDCVGWQSDWSIPAHNFNTRHCREADVVMESFAARRCSQDAATDVAVAWCASDHESSRRADATESCAPAWSMPPRTSHVRAESVSSSLRNADLSAVCPAARQATGAQT